MKHRFIPAATKAMFTILSTIALPVVASAQQQCLKNAWAAFNKLEYGGAMKAADECIEDFGARAMKEQAALESKHEKAPPTGAVDNASDKKQIVERWAINDVSTAYFVKGRSAEYLFKKQKIAKYKQLAEESYKSAMKLTYGRCYDPQGWFWSPAEASSERLALVK